MHTIARLVWWQGDSSPGFERAACGTATPASLSGRSLTSADEAEEGTAAVTASPAPAAAQAVSGGAHMAVLSPDSQKLHRTFDGQEQAAEAGAVSPLRQGR